MIDDTEGRRMYELTEEQAVALYESRFWESMTYEERARFQMKQDRLCMPLEIFHEALEKALGRPVWTHELGLNRDGLMNELFRGGRAPTLEEIINLIPEEKRILLAIK